MIEIRLTYGSISCLAGTIISLFLIKYNPNPILLVLLPIWGLIFGIALANVVLSKSSKKKIEKKDL